MRNPIIAALDVADEQAALGLIKQLAGAVGAFKVGKELFVTAGPDLVRRIRDLGADVFLDLKFHDIPNTVAGAVAAATRLDVQMLTVHACGGSAMLAAAQKAARETADEAGRTPPLILGVTVLTSMDQNDLDEVGVADGPAVQVERLATLAARNGLGGLVCSPLEIVSLRRIIPAEMKLITPGIRPAGSAAGDQKRILTPRQAIDAGADWLVIGRPIYAADDPASAVATILEELATA